MKQYWHVTPREAGDPEQFKRIKEKIECFDGNGPPVYMTSAPRNPKIAQYVDSSPGSGHDIIDKKYFSYHVRAIPSFRFTIREDLNPEKDLELQSNETDILADTIRDHLTEGGETWEQ